MSIKIGIAGPVGSGKTSIIEQLTNILKDKYSLGIVTNDIYTTEDATIEFLEILKISPLVLSDATSSMLNLCFL